MHTPNNKKQSCNKRISQGMSPKDKQRIQDSCSGVPKEKLRKNSKQAALLVARTSRAFILNFFSYYKRCLLP